MRQQSKSSECGQTLVLRIVHEGYLSLIHHDSFHIYQEVWWFTCPHSHVDTVKRIPINNCHHIISEPADTTNSPIGKIANIGQIRILRRVQRIEGDECSRIDWESEWGRRKSWFQYKDVMPQITFTNSTQRKISVGIEDKNSRAFRIYT